MGSYRAAIRTGRRLPVGYMKETAELYCVELNTAFCYLILGADRSGKSVFLRNLMCAAADLKKGERWLIDLDNTDGLSAAASDTKHVTDSDGMIEFMRVLLQATNERGALRKELRAEGLDDEEIYERMAERFPPLFVFIANLKTFMDAAYKRLEGVGLPSAGLEKIFERGQSLNVFFFAAASTSSVPLLSDKLAYLSFTKGRTGVLLATELTRQNVFQYQNVRYNEQNKRYKTGVCYATNQRDTQNVDLVVFPNNRKSKAE